MRAHEASALVGMSNNYVCVMASQYKKKHGHHPIWYIKKSTRLTNIDLKKFTYYMYGSRRVWIYATEHLYWLLLATSHSLSDIARLMAKKSKYFTNFNSWSSWLSNALFQNILEESPLVKPTMLTEFVRIGTKHLYLLRVWDNLDLTKEDEYYER